MTRLGPLVAGSGSAGRLMGGEPGPRGRLVSSSAHAGRGHRTGGGALATVSPLGEVTPPRAAARPHRRVHGYRRRDRLRLRHRRAFRHLCGRRGRGRRHGSRPATGEAAGGQGQDPVRRSAVSAVRPPPVRRDDGRWEIATSPTSSRGWTAPPIRRRASSATRNRPRKRRPATCPPGAGAGLGPHARCARRPTTACASVATCASWWSARPSIRRRRRRCLTVGPDPDGQASVRLQTLPAVGREEKTCEDEAMVPAVQLPGAGRRAAGGAGLPTAVQDRRRPAGERLSAAGAQADAAPIGWRRSPLARRP